MKIAIVYDTHTGTTGAAADRMAEAVRSAGHECTSESVSNADPRQVAGADAAVFGAWTKGYFIIGQHPSEGMLEFLEKVTLKGRPTAVFATYRLAAGSTVRQLANAAEAAGGKVTGLYKVRGPNVPEGFEAWVESLGSSRAI